MFHTNGMEIIVLILFYTFLQKFHLSKIPSPVWGWTSSIFLSYWDIIHIPWKFPFHSVCMIQGFFSILHRVGQPSPFCNFRMFHHPLKNLYSLVLATPATPSPFFLSLCLFWTVHINETIQHVVFLSCLASFCFIIILNCFLLWLS